MRSVGAPTELKSVGKPFLQKELQISFSRVSVAWWRVATLGTTSVVEPSGESEWFDPLHPLRLVLCLDLPRPSISILRLRLPPSGEPPLGGRGRTFLQRPTRCPKQPDTVPRTAGKFSSGSPFWWRGTKLLSGLPVRRPHEDAVRLVQTSSALRRPTIW